MADPVALHEPQVLGETWARKVERGVSGATVGTFREQCDRLSADHSHASTHPSLLLEPIGSPAPSPLSASAPSVLTGSLCATVFGYPPDKGGGRNVLISISAWLVVAYLIVRCGITFTPTVTSARVVRR